MNQKDNDFRTSLNKLPLWINHKLSYNITIGSVGNIIYHLLENLENTFKDHHSYSQHKTDSWVDNKADCLSSTLQIIGMSL